jgi:tetratricopeptide (TPR) repeat protein
VRAGLPSCGLGTLQRLTGDYQAAAVNIGQALEQFRDIGSPDRIAQASHDLGWLQQDTGDYRAAAASHLEALRIYTGCGDPLGQARILNSLGQLYARTGDTAEALDHHTRALAIARELFSLLEEAQALEGIGRSKLGHNNREAEAGLRQALGIYERLGTPESQRVQATLGELALTQTPDPLASSSEH